MGRIFISYRRADSAAGDSRMVAQALRQTYGHDAVFRDVLSIPPGEDFADFIQKSLSDCEVLLVMIGQAWLTTADSKGGRRIDNPDDWVRIEVATALKRGVRVVPVLVGGASLPRAEDLPDDLKALVRRNAFPLSDRDFDRDLARLVEELRGVVPVTWVHKLTGGWRPATGGWAGAGSTASAMAAPSAGSRKTWIWWAIGIALFLGMLDEMMLY